MGYTLHSPMAAFASLDLYTGTLSWYKRTPYIRFPRFTLLNFLKQCIKLANTLLFPCYLYSDNP